MFGIGEARWFEAVAADPGAATDAELNDWLAELDRFDAQVLLARSRVLAAWQQRQVWAVDGAVSPAAWRASQGEVSRSDALRELRVARRLACMPVTVAALEAGRIGAGKARLLAEARREDLAERFDEAEADLVGWCEPLTVDQCGQLLAHWERTVRPDGPAPDPRDRCELFVSETFDGTHIIKGRLDAEWGSAFSRALQAIVRDLDTDADADKAGGGGAGGPVVGSGVGSEEVPRSAAWRRSEALMELTRRATAGRGGVPARPSVIALVDADLLDGPAGGVAPLGAVCEVDGGGRVDPEMVRRLSCDGIVTLAATADGAVLELGRSVRLASEDQRRALLVRDKGCVFPGCDRPGQWCEAHHLVRWEAGGPTDLANLALLCSRHHHLVHEGGFAAARGDDGELRFTRPDGTEIERRRPNRLPPRYPPRPPRRHRPPPEPPNRPPPADGEAA
ncbi:MAG TPA: DUF222 domain-containing protein [Acidimicrobiales bacterium]|jgi:hypothetical protein|nr:DUF222 domain-containing protein [Acidimicrobiales bacterium]